MTASLIFSCWILLFWTLYSSFIPSLIPPWKSKKRTPTTMLRPLRWLAVRLHSHLKLSRPKTRNSKNARPLLARFRDKEKAVDAPKAMLNCHSKICSLRSSSGYCLGMTEARCASSAGNSMSWDNNDPLENPRYQIPPSRKWMSGTRQQSLCAPAGLLGSKYTIICKAVIFHGALLRSR